MYKLTIDQGTSSSKVYIFDKNDKIIISKIKEHKQIIPYENYIEHNPNEILEIVNSLLEDALNDFKDKFPNEILNSVGITNQRETLVVWSKITHKPLYNAIVWNDNRNMDLISRLLKKYEKNYFKNINGLYINTYFTLFKFLWLLENNIEIKTEYENNNLLIGTIDSWLSYNLLENYPHITDPSNASRTFLMNLKTLNYDKEILNTFDIKLNILPKIMPSNYFHGKLKLDNNLRLWSILGDQQSACLGWGILDNNSIKCTWGTGCFMIKNIGYDIDFKDGLITTVLWKNGDEKPVYGLEASIEIGANVLNYFKNELKLFNDFNETEEDIFKTEYQNNKLISNLSMNEYFAPYWRKNNKTSIIGINFNTKSCNIYQSILENIAHRIYDSYKIIQSGNTKLVLDGGVSNSKYLSSYLKCLIGNNKIYRSLETEGTSLGVSYGTQVKEFLEMNQFNEHIIKKIKYEEIEKLVKITNENAIYKYKEFNKLVNN